MPIIGITNADINPVMLLSQQNKERKENIKHVNVKQIRWFVDDFTNTHFVRFWLDILETFWKFKGTVDFGISVPIF